MNGHLDQMLSSLRKNINRIRPQYRKSNLICYTFSQLPAVHLQKHCKVQQNHRPGNAFISRYNIGQTRNKHKTSFKHKTSYKHKTNNKHKGTFRSDFFCMWERSYKKLNEMRWYYWERDQGLKCVNIFTARSDASTAVISLFFTFIYSRAASKLIRIQAFFFTKILFFKLFSPSVINYLPFFIRIIAKTFHIFHYF